MKKPTTLPPSAPKPRPPPKPDIPPKSGKPIIPPKPKHQTSSSTITTNSSKARTAVKADLVEEKIERDEIPKRPPKPLHLLNKNVVVSNDISEKTEPHQEITEPDADNFYDDINVDFDISNNMAVNLCKVQPPRKPLPQLPTKPTSCSLTVTPTPSPRLSPQVSPSSSARASPYVSPSLSPTHMPESKHKCDRILPSPRPRAAAVGINKENNGAKTKSEKPKIPPKSEHLQKLYASNKVLHNRKNTQKKRDTIQKQQQLVTHPKEENPSRPLLPVSPNINSLESDECTDCNHKSDGFTYITTIGGPNIQSETIKKRIASRRQLNPRKASRNLPADVKTRRPPPPPPTDIDRGHNRAPLGFRSHANAETEDTSPISSQRTAEDQPLYSYAYEHTFVPVTEPSVSSLGNQSNDTTFNADSYVEPDATAVNSFMKELRIKEGVSSGQYEIPEEEVANDSQDGQQFTNTEPIEENIDETDSVTSDEYTFPDQVIADDKYLEESSDSEDYHEYEYPDDSPPPVPPHGKKTRSGSYNITIISHDISDNDDDEEDDDYVEPPDAQGSSEEELDEPFWEEDDDDDDDDNESFEEPLYQVYTARTLQRDRTLSRKRTNSSEQTDTVIDDLTKGTLRNMRMLWCEIPKVISSGILATIDPEERKRQEAMFEVVTSEASYLKSMNILESHFINSPELTPGTPHSVIEKAQHHILFSNVRIIIEASQMFLETLRRRQTEALIISSISDIIEEFATKRFEVYVKYCSNQIYQDRVLKELRKSPRYVEGIKHLEKSSTAQCLSMQSFLVLPMQRITRLPLLVDAICHRCEPGSDEFVKTDAALKAINKVVQNCNEGARKMERMEEMVHLQPQIEFTTKPIALVSASRWLLRRGEVVLVIEQIKTPLSKKKLKLKPVYMFLFNDLLLITKKKGESRYRVLDYAARHMTKVEECTDPSIQLDFMLSLILLENCNGKTKDYILCAESETDKTRWLEAFNPPKAEREGEKVYGAWDCPQVQVIHNYNPQQPDELALHEGDVINVQRKLSDGWYYGERLCDGVCGWFPANYTENIRNEHVRARNLLQRYRLLVASKHLIGAVQTMKAPKTSILPKGIMKRDTIS